MLRLFFSFLMLFSIQLLAQQKKPAHSGTATQEAKMKKEMEEAEKAIEELEKDDPEAAKMARQMLGKVKAGNGQLKSAKPDVPVNDLPSPIASIPAKIIPPAPSKAEAKDRLLWYRGKKVDANTLVTE